MNLKDFEALLPISKSDLDSELETQAATQWHIASLLAAANMMRDDMKDVHDRVKAEVSMQALIRDPSLSVAKVNMVVDTAPTRIRAWEDYLEYKKDAERWASMYEAWRSRGFALKSLCDLHASDYFAVSSHTTRPSADAAVQRHRQALADDRKERGAVRRRVVISE